MNEHDEENQNHESELYNPAVKHHIGPSAVHGARQHAVLTGDHVSTRQRSKLLPLHLVEASKHIFTKKYS